MNVHSKKTYKDKRGNNMTKDELRFLCESQIAQCETWAERPHGKFYEACKSIIELLDENELLVETLNECSRKRGKWIMTNDYFTGAYGNIDYVKCSCCGEDSLEEGDYCPNCGAYMREVEE